MEVPLLLRLRREQVAFDSSSDPSVRSIPLTLALAPGIPTPLPGTPCLCLEQEGGGALSRAAKTLPTMTLLKLMIAHVLDRFALETETCGARQVCDVPTVIQLLMHRGRMQTQVPWFQ